MLFQGIKQHTKPAYYNFNLIFSELIIRHQTTARISENTKQDKYNTHTHSHTHKHTHTNIYTQSLAYHIKTAPNKRQKENVEDRQGKKPT